MPPVENESFSLWKFVTGTKSKTEKATLHSLKMVPKLLECYIKYRREIAGDSLYENMLFHVGLFNSFFKSQTRGGNCHNPQDWSKMKSNSTVNKVCLFLRFCV